MKRALLIGINHYLEPGNDLNGCLNDVRLMYKILKEIYGFTEFIILDDQKATKKSWLEALIRLGKKSEPGDWLAHIASSHGTQVPTTKDTFSYEIDGLDECPVPYDHSWDAPLRDDDLNHIIMSIHPDVNLFFQFDMCHSAHMLRNIAPVHNGHPIKARYLPPPLHVTLESGELDLDDELNLASSRDRTDKMKLKPFLRNAVDQANAILISGCKDNQTSADFYTGTTYHGALTFYLAQTLKEAGWKISYQKLVEIVNQKLAKDGFDQKPQLECKATFFNKNFLE